MKPSLVTRSLGVRLFAFAFLVGQLGAQPVAFYDAAINGAGWQPTSEFPTVSPFNWEQTVGGSTVVSQTSESIGGDTIHYFRINASASGRSGARSYTVSLSSESPAFNDPEGWTCTAVVRVPFADGNISTGAYVRVDDGIRTHIVSFINEAGFQGLGYGKGLMTYKPIQLQAADISSDYVTVQMWYNPAASQTTVYLDGIAQGSFSSSDAPPANSCKVSWGRGTGTGNGSDVYWNYVALEAGKTVVVPEVSSSR